MTWNSHMQGSSKNMHGPAHEDLGDADIEWINDVITKQKERKAPLSISALRQEMASCHKRTGGHRKPDALASTWHGGSRGMSQRSHHAQTSMSKMTMDTEEPTLPTMEELQTIMAAKLSYSKVKERVKDQAQPQPSTSMESKATKSLPTIEDLQSLMAQASATKVNGPDYSGMTAADKSQEQKDSAKKNRKILEPKIQDRAKLRSNCKTSLSPVPHSKGDSSARKHRGDGSKLDSLRSSHHRRTTRSEADSTQQEIPHKVVDGSLSKIREPLVGSSHSKQQIHHDLRNIKTRQTESGSQGRNRHDPRDTSSVASNDQLGQNGGNDQRSPRKAKKSGEKDADETKSSHSSSSGNRSSSLEPKPRNRAGSRGRSQISSATESSGDASRRKVRSTSGNRGQQRQREKTSVLDAMTKRRVAKGTKQEFTAGTKPGHHSMQKRIPVALSDQEDNGDVDDSIWMAASMMNFDDDWGNFRPKSTRPALDAKRAKKLAAADDQHRR